MKRKVKQQIIAEVLNFQVTTSILDHVSDLVWIKDKQGRYVGVSESFSCLVGQEKEQLVGQIAKDLGLCDAEDEADDCRVVQGAKQSISRKTYQLPDGSVRLFEIHKSPICDIHGQVAGLIATGRDVTELVQRQEYLQYIGYHDMLTRLHNRNYFEQLPAQLAEAKVRSLGVVICDIDGLKLINDTLGHAAGDERLKTSAAILTAAAGEKAKVARIGGDEFLIAVPEATQDTLDKIVQRMKDQLEQSNAQNDSYPLNISFGSAIGDLGATDFFSLYKEADNAMYRDKMLHEESPRHIMTKTMMKMLSMKDYIMEGHADRLQDYVAAIGQALGMSASRINDLKLLAEFHDIGKIGIPEAVLKKPAALTPEEQKLIRRHPEIGYHFSKTIPDLSPISSWILKHHEWWNGTGYPLGLQGEEIPLEARIVHIADAFDAMTHNRPYRKSLSLDCAVRELKRGAGPQFDPNLVETFLGLDLVADYNQAKQVS